MAGTELSGWKLFLNYAYQHEYSNDCSGGGKAAKDHEDVPYGIVTSGGLGVASASFLCLLSPFVSRLFI